MQSLNLPKFEFRFKKDEKNRACIFDAQRKKWLVFTPEEWVRQHWLRFLIEHLAFPSALIQIEGGLKFNSRQKRSDILVYRSIHPLVLIECKAPSVKIGNDVLDQALNYNLTLNVQYIVLTNGLEHIFLKRKETKLGFERISNLPKYSDL